MDDENMNDEKFKDQKFKDQKFKDQRLKLDTDKEKPDQNKRNATRDGNKDRLRSWAGVIVDSINACGTGDPGTWYTRKAIDRMVVQHCGRKPQTLNQCLRALVKGGYIERALKPASVMDKFTTQREYLYRRTSKPYQERVKLVKLREGLVIRNNHKKLPQWFRRMMQF